MTTQLTTNITRQRERIAKLYATRLSLPKYKTKERADLRNRITFCCRQLGIMNAVAAKDY